MRTYLLGAVIASVLIAAAPRASAAVHWYHETAVYFDVWDKEKAQCQAAYTRGLDEAQRLPTADERSSAIRAAKEQRKLCRGAAKRDAHEAHLKARKERWDAVREKRRSKASSEH